MYRDITTYNQRDRERTPRILENISNGVSFKVHKHIDYGDEWLLSCNEPGCRQNEIGYREHRTCKRESTD